MITKLEFAQPHNALDDSSKTNPARRQNQAMATGDAVSLSLSNSADGAMQQAEESIPRMCDFSDVLNWTVGEVSDLKGVITAMTPEDSEAFMDSALSAGPPPALIKEDFPGLDETAFNSDPFYGDHKGQLYNFKLRQWVDADQ